MLYRISLNSNNHKMPLRTGLATLKPFNLLNFGYFSTCLLLTIVSESFAQLLNVYAPKYETANKFWLI
jgi:hypothetical protein